MGYFGVAAERHFGLTVNFETTTASMARGGTFRWLRRLGLAMMICGVLSIAWAVVVWQWQDPFTALYTMYKQHELGQAYDKRAHAFQLALPATPAVAPAHGSTPAKKGVSLAADERAVSKAAREYRLESHQGEALGRIVVPRLGLNMIFVDGTNDESLMNGPGRDLQTFMPGENRLVYIAGHRTTFLAPFSAINTMKPGDTITLELPYATFIYRVTGHVIVAATDMAVLRSPDHELLALQACNPRFFATQRYIVYARPTRVIPEKKLGSPYTLASVRARLS
jgi:sortase A